VISTLWGISKHTDDSGETICREWITQGFLRQQIIINPMGGKMLNDQKRGSWMNFVLEWDQEALSLCHEESEGAEEEEGDN
jgi:hypothetical protein